MEDRRFGKRTVRRAALAGAVFFLISGCSSAQLKSREYIDPAADEILRAMSSYLGGLTAFKMKADIGSEIINLEGQKLQLSSFSTIVIERPWHLRVTRKGMFADVEIIYDGETVTIHGNKHNVYAQFEVPGSIDDAIRAVEFETGLDAPGADLLFADPYATLSSGIVSSDYLGTDYVHGVECHHLAFREDKVDWQLWVQVGDTPLPMKYVITSKWQTGAPQYTLQFRDWNTKPQIEAGAFSFSVPKGASMLDTIPVNELGELALAGEEQ